MRIVLYLVTWTLVAFGLSSPAFAGNNKPPSSACYSMDNALDQGYYEGGVLALAFKSTGKIKTALGTSKQYNVHGAIGDEGSVPPPNANRGISGSVYWDIEAEEAAGHLVGGSAEYPTHCYIHVKSVSDSVISCKRENEDMTEYEYSLTPIDCRTIELD